MTKTIVDCLTHRVAEYLLRLDQMKYEDARKEATRYSFATVEELQATLRTVVERWREMGGLWAEHQRRIEGE